MFETHNQLVEYLRKNINNKVFQDNYTRPQLRYMLKTLCPYSNWGKDMCKKRQIKHLKAWLILHDYI